jgi:hypothetical protein
MRQIALLRTYLHKSFVSEKIVFGYGNWVHFQHSPIWEAAIEAVLKKAHPQNVQLLNVQLPNVQFLKVLIT